MLTLCLWSHNIVGCGPMKSVADGSLKGIGLGSVAEWNLKKFREVLVSDSAYIGANAKFQGCLGPTNPSRDSFRRVCRVLSTRDGQEGSVLTTQIQAPAQKSGCPNR